MASRNWPGPLGLFGGGEHLGAGLGVGSEGEAHKEEDEQEETNRHNERIGFTPGKLIVIR
jgi:hypothetical protein